MYKNTLQTRQFVAFLRGEAPLHTPKSELRTREVVEEQRTCLRCCQTCEHDKVVFANGITWLVCRCCRVVSEDGVMTSYKMMDDGTLVEAA